MNELPDFLFPEGKHLRRHRKRVQKTEEEVEKKPKVESLWCVCFSILIGGVCSVEGVFNEEYSELFDEELNRSMKNTQLLNEEHSPLLDE